MSVNFKPTLDKILVKADVAEESTVGGIIIPVTAKEKPQTGEVVAVGEGKDGPLTSKVGDGVFFSSGGGTEIKIDNRVYLVMRESDILGIYER